MTAITDLQILCVLVPLVAIVVGYLGADLYMEYFGKDKDTDK
jgi:hypothetical protein